MLDLQGQFGERGYKGEPGEPGIPGNAVGGDPGPQGPPGLQVRNYSDIIRQRAADGPAPII